MPSPQCLACLQPALQANLEYMFVWRLRKLLTTSPNVDPCFQPHSAGQPGVHVQELWLLLPRLPVPVRPRGPAQIPGELSACSFVCCKSVLRAKLQIGAGSQSCKSVQGAKLLCGHVPRCMPRQAAPACLHNDPLCICSSIHYREPSCSTATCRCTSLETTPLPSSSKACMPSRWVRRGVGTCGAHLLCFGCSPAVLCNKISPAAPPACLPN